MDIFKTIILNMNNKIKKINLNHSFIFFFIANIFCFLMFKFNLIIPSILCLLLVLIVGVSHGSLDHVKGKKLLELLNIKSTYIFYITYLLIAAIVILTWIILPSITLIIFLMIASYHFGKEDTQFLINDRSYFTQILYFFNFKGVPWTFFLLFPTVAHQIINKIIPITVSVINCHQPDLFIS